MKKEMREIQKDRGRKSKTQAGEGRERGRGAETGSHRGSGEAPGRRELPSLTPPPDLTSCGERTKTQLLTSEGTPRPRSMKPGASEGVDSGI